MSLFIDRPASHSPRSLSLKDKSGARRTYFSLK